MLGKLVQSVHEGIAYFSSYETVMKNIDFVPMSQPKRKKQPKAFFRKRGRLAEAAVLESKAQKP